MHITKLCGVAAMLRTKRRGAHRLCCVAVPASVKKNTPFAQAFA